MRTLQFVILLLLVAPWFPLSPVSAAHDLTCHPVRIDFFLKIPGIPGEATTGMLKLQVNTNGESTLNGALVIHDQHPPQTLVAHKKSSGSSASCADTDNDGSAGLTLLTADLTDPHGGSTVPFRLTSSVDIDESGAYDVAFEIGDTLYRGIAFIEVQATTGPDR